MWDTVLQCSTALGLVFSLHLGASYRYVWVFKPILNRGF